MDRFLAAGLAFSASAHALFIMHLPAPGAGRPAGDPIPFSVEFNLVGVGAGGAAGEAASFTALPAGAGEAADPNGRGEPEPYGEGILQGTGEILREIVRETLTPLLAQEGRPSEEFVRAVNRYKRLLEEILDRESTLSYPDAARSSGREARFHIRFSLRSDGSIESVEIPQGSGGFERALASGLRKAAAHFPPFPDDIGCERLTFSWPVRFSLQ
ncbi:MAG: TonB family protein [bacterium]|nr:TonB family protein [bacterium]